MSCVEGSIMPFWSGVPLLGVGHTGLGFYCLIATKSCEVFHSTVLGVGHTQRDLWNRVPEGTKHRAERPAEGVPSCPQRNGAPF